MPSPFSSTLSLTLWAGVLAVSPAPQQVPVTVLSAPERVTDRGFTELVGVRELRDGQVILLDKSEVSVLLLDQELHVIRTIGRTGSGPGEYRSPSQLFSFVGDTSAVVDYANGRLLLLGPHAEPVGVRNLTEVPGRFTSVFGGDNRGRVYLTSGGGDSRIFMRWSPVSPILDTVWALQSSTDPSSANIALISGGFNPFQPTKAFAVGPAGEVAIVHPGPYRVEVITPRGNRLEGPRIPIETVEVTEGHKQQWLEDHSRPVTRLGVARGSRTPERTSVRPRIPEPTWPKYLPPFLSQSSARFSPDGRLWVERTTPVDQPPTFDVFDSAGSRVEQVKLPFGRRLLGFGRNSIYSVVRDELDLEYLERFTLQRLRR